MREVRNPEWRKEKNILGTNGMPLQVLTRLQVILQSHSTQRKQQNRRASDHDSDSNGGDRWALVFSDPEINHTLTKELTKDRNKAEHKRMHPQTLICNGESYQC
jgi:hypothetical protein